MSPSNFATFDLVNHKLFLYHNNTVYVQFNFFRIVADARLQFIRIMGVWTRHIRLNDHLHNYDLIRREFIKELFFMLYAP